MAARFDAELIFQHVVPPGPYEHGFIEGGYNVSSVWPSREEMEERLLEQMQELVANSDWEVDITKSFPAMTSDGGLALRRPDENFKDLLGRIKKDHRGSKINDWR